MIIGPLDRLTDAEISVLENHAASVIISWTGGLEPVTAERRKYAEPTSMAGGPWVIFYGGRNFNRNGEWEWEPMPSGRTEEFLKRCRFDSLKEAIGFWNSKGRVPE